MNSHDSWLNSEVNRILTYILKKGLVGIVRFMEFDYNEGCLPLGEPAIKIFTNPLEEEIEFRKREYGMFNREIYERICEKYRFEDSKMVDVEIEESCGGVVTFNFRPCGRDCFEVRNRIYRKLVEIFKYYRSWYLEEGPIEIFYLNKLKFKHMYSCRKFTKFDENNLFNITLVEI